MESYRTDSTKFISDFFDGPRPRSHPRWHMKYFTSGFIILQDLIDQAIIKAQTGRNELPKMYMQQFPSPCYVFDTFFEGISNMFPIFMILSFVFSCSMTIKSIVREKELRLKETMRTMGLGNAVHWVAWFIDSFSSMALACIFLSLILVVSPPQTSPTKQNLLDSFLLVWQRLGTLGILPGLCVLLGFQHRHCVPEFPHIDVLQQSQLGRSLWRFHLLDRFHSLQPHRLTGPEFQTRHQRLDGKLDAFTARQTIDERVVLQCLLSNVAFGIGCEYFANFELVQTGAQWSNFAKSPMSGDEFSLAGVIIMLLVDSAIYLILTWYIETVFPGKIWKEFRPSAIVTASWTIISGKFGVPKPFYFMFQPSYWCPSRQKNVPVVDYEHERSGNRVIKIDMKEIG